MDSSRRPRLSRPFAIAVLAALAIATLLPGEAHAASGITDTATTTYEVLPDLGIVRVAIDFRIQNRISSKVQRSTCTQSAVDPYFGSYTYTTTCTRTTRYYVNWTSTWIQASARDIHATSDAGAVSIKVEKRERNYKLVRFTYRPIYRNATRKLHVTYVLGGKPRSPDVVRAGAAYTSFCVTGNGIDGGSVRVIAPAEFAIVTTEGELSEKTVGGKSMMSSGELKKPEEFYVCLEGTNDDALKTTTVHSPAGRELEIDAWPEDPMWEAAVQARVAASVASLEALLGGAFPGAETIRIRETAASALGNYVGKYNAISQVASVSEAWLDDPTTVGHELAHAWFNEHLFRDDWLNEGYAEWAARSADPTSSERCGDPGVYPGTGTPELADWAFAPPEATDAEKKLVNYDYDASCFVITALDSALPSGGMQKALQYLFDRRIPYLPDSAERLSPGPMSSRTWLDVIDEVGVGRSITGLDLAAKLAMDYGIETDVSLMATRRWARDTYRQYLSMSGWSVPSFVGHEMADWKFDDAVFAMGVAGSARNATTQTDSALPGIDAANGAVKDRVQKAASIDELEAAQRFAYKQVDAAKVVAPAVAAAKAARGPLDAIGLLGVDVAALSADAIAAVKAGNAREATGIAARLNAELQEATASGAIRLGVVLFALVGLAIAVMLARSGPRQRRAAAVTTPPEE